jgi:hypothetical protein
MFYALLMILPVRNCKENCAKRTFYPYVSTDTIFYPPQYTCNTKFLFVSGSQILPPGIKWRGLLHDVLCQGSLEFFFNFVIFVHILGQFLNK